MIKIVVFDSGYGGELFADLLESELPCAEIIRVIDWRNAKQILAGRRSARRVAKKALSSYIGHVDLIVFANHLLSLTSLGYFRRRYKNQAFVGLEIAEPATFTKRQTIILTTKAVTKTVGFLMYLLRLGRKPTVICLDQWPDKIDDGELSDYEIKRTLSRAIDNTRTPPDEVVLACSQFNDIKNSIREIFGNNIKIYDSFNCAKLGVMKALKIRGGAYQKQK